jgi:hypothetical protein
MYLKYIKTSQKYKEQKLSIKFRDSALKMFAIPGIYIVTNSQVLFHDGSLLHSKFNTQLLITVHSSSSFSPVYNYWLRSFYGNVSVTLLYGTLVFSLLRYYGTIATLYYQLLQQRWHYWVKGTSHMQHHQGNPICHNILLTYYYCLSALSAE